MEISLDWSMAVGGWSNTNRGDKQINLLSPRIGSALYSVFLKRETQQGRQYIILPTSESPAIFRDSDVNAHSSSESPRKHATRARAV